MNDQERKDCHKRWSRRNKPYYPAFLPKKDPVRKQYEAGRQCYNCVHYVELRGPLGMDWGVCGCKKGEFDGRVVFEHFSCEFWKSIQKEKKR